MTPVADGMLRRGRPKGSATGATRYQVRELSLVEHARTGRWPRAGLLASLLGISTEAVRLHRRALIETDQLPPEACRGWRQRQAPAEALGPRSPG